MKCEKNRTGAKPVMQQLHLQPVSHLIRNAARMCTPRDSRWIRRGGCQWSPLRPRHVDDEREWTFQWSAIIVPKFIEDRMQEKAPRPNEERTLESHTPFRSSAASLQQRRDFAQPAVTVLELEAVLRTCLWATLKGNDSPLPGWKVRAASRLLFVLLSSLSP